MTTKKTITRCETYYSVKRNSVQLLTEFMIRLYRKTRSDEPEFVHHKHNMKKFKDSTLLFCSKTANLIEQVGGYIWLTDKINEIPELERERYIRSVHAIKSWADTMEYNINNKIKESSYEKQRGKNYSYRRYHLYVAYYIKNNTQVKEDLYNERNSKMV